MLEVGGGHGVAASVVLERLDSGRFVGVDRSAKMIAAAERRNSGAVRARRAEFIIGEIPGADLGERRFDVIFAARVAAMTRSPGLASVAQLLKPLGGLVLAFDSPSDAQTVNAVDTAVANLASAGLRAESTTSANVDGGLVMCLRARASRRPGSA